VADNEKVYAFVTDPEGLVTQWHSNQWDNPDPEPEVTPPSGQIAVHLDAGDLGGSGSYAEFGDSRKAVIIEGAFDSWTARAPAPSLVVDSDPPDDGSAPCVVTLDLGVANSLYRIRFTRESVACNLQDCKGVIDDQGDATFNLKVFGPGDFDVIVEPDGHADFMPATLNIHVVAGGF
jgi:hypothetical protein